VLGNLGEQGTLACLVVTCQVSGRGAAPVRLQGVPGGHLALPLHPRHLQAVVPLNFLRTVNPGFLELVHQA